MRHLYAQIRCASLSPLTRFHQTKRMSCTSLTRSLLGSLTPLTAQSHRSLPTSLARIPTAYALIATAAKKPKKKHSKSLQAHRRRHHGPGLRQSLVLACVASHKRLRGMRVRGGVGGFVLTPPPGDPPPIQLLLQYTPALYKGFTFCLQRGGGAQS